MSSTYLIPFKDGMPYGAVEFRNAWGGSARIWTSLFDKYVPKRHEYDTWLSNPNDNRLWSLAQSDELEIFERAVMAFTLDLFYVRNEHFLRFANDLMRFTATLPSVGVDHLPAWAEWMKSNPHVEALGLHGTSVSENPWRRTKRCKCCDQALDESEFVPLSEGTEVYDWLEAVESARK